MSYDEVNDYELLSIVADNEDATEILFKKYRPLIVGIARKFYSSIKNNGCDFNDFVQEAMIAFSMAINTFDEKKDALFFTYAKTCIERRLSTLLRTFNRAKNQLLNESYSVDLLADDAKSLENLLEDNNSNPENRIIENENINEIIKKIEKSLTDLECEVFELKISGFNYKEIAEILDKDSKAIDNAIRRIRIKAKNYMNND